MEFLASIIIGAVSGWLAGKFMGTSHSLIINIILGLLGGVLGGWLGGFVGIGATGWISSIIISVIGACILIWLSKKIFK